MTFDLINWLNQQSGGHGLPLTLSRLNSPSDTSGSSDRREWLVTNGLGSYASGSITGANTRRYHGLLVASLAPPVKRTVLLSHLDETLSIGDGAERFQLATNHWQSGIVAPQGYTLIEAFSDLPVPTWSYRLPGGRLIKQVLMQSGAQTVYVGYTWLADDGKTPAHLNLAVLVNHRDFHGETRGADNWLFIQDQKAQGADGDNLKSVTISAYQGAQSICIQLDRGQYSRSANPSWYRDYHWPREFERGLGDHEDCFHSGDITATLAHGQSLTVAAGLKTLDTVPLFADLVRDVALAKAGLISNAASDSAELSPALKRLILAADQFVARRESTDGSTIIAGYHWFSDWGRDSMISLPGLCLSTGRTAIGKSILATFGKYLSEGMLPNYFPDGGQTPEYNTSDATLWWAEALYRYYKATGDKEFVKAQLPLLQEVVDWHVKGTRHGLKLADDGLVTGGGPDVQLTWMDAKCGDYVVTPRSGKAVEISALWHNFVLVLDYLKEQCGLAEQGSNGATAGSAFAARARAGFEKFWDEKRGYLADVVHDDGSVDEAIRPNQLFAASLTFPIVSVERARKIVAVVEEKLLTPMGMRTLSPDHPDYKGHYGLGKASANQYDRDVTYHQGTVWPWLLGPWVNARLYAYGHTDENLAFITNHLKAILDHIEGDACVGSVSEIFDGDAPHKAQGCVAQAWSIAELLRVLREHPQLAD
ncbi:MAG: glycogen debranching enzyme family protein [Cyanobacteria bacterium SZAS LIN-3]|nr:glycogen debranching enzyme family protein [Cyanobacteria bacterium SZAS LIN-3]